MNIQACTIPSGPAAGRIVRRPATFPREAAFPGRPVRVVPAHRVRTRLLAGWAGLLLAMMSIPAAGEPIRTLTGLRLSRARANIRGIENDSTLGTGILLGFETPAYRLYIDLSHHDYPEAETRVFFASGERLLVVGHRVAVMAGMHGGVADLTPNLPAFRHQKYASGFAGGGQTGLLIRLARNWQLEAGLRHSLFNVKIDSPERDHRLRLNHQTEFFLALSVLSH